MLQLEPQILQQAASGDRHAFARLYQHFVGRVYAIAWRLLANRSRAEDAVQETFIKVWQLLPAFRGDSEFSTWLHRLAVNTTIDLWRKDKGLRLEDGDAIPETACNTQHSDEQQQQLEQAIQRLPAQARAVFVLFALEGYQHREIATLLQIAEGSSKAQYHRARQLLQEYLNERD